MNTSTLDYPNYLWLWSYITIRRSRY